MAVLVGGSITFDEGVERSSNVAFAILGDQKLGPERFRKYIHSFGLDEKTNIDLSGEGSNTILFDQQIQQVTTAFWTGFHCNTNSACTSCNGHCK